MVGGTPMQREGGSTMPSSLRAGKVLPHSLDLEEAILGALLIEQSAFSQVVDMLKPEVFYSEKNRVVYEVMLELYQASETIDMSSVTAALIQKAELDRAGGVAYIAQLTERINSAANIEDHVRLVTEKANKRKLIELSSVIYEESFDGTRDAFELMKRTQEALFEVQEGNIRKNYEDMESLIGQAIDELEEKKSRGDTMTGVPSGFKALDDLTAGFQHSDLIIVAARPGMGKTSFVVSALRNAAIDYGTPVALFSLEMSSVQLVNRMISSEAEVESGKLRKGNLNQSDLAKVHSAVKTLTNAKLFIDDTPGLSLLELRAKCRRLKAQHDIQMVVIDYLQLMSGGPTGSKGPGNREQEIGNISRGLKGLAKELNVPVIALSQLSRAVETRGGDKRPQLSDLRESGSIEQDADQVMFLYRPEYYDITEDEEGNPLVDVGYVILAKNRHGDTKDVPLRFIGKYTKFGDLEDGSALASMEDPLAGGISASDDNFEMDTSLEGGEDVIILGSRANQEGAAEDDGADEPDFGSAPPDFENPPF